MTEQEEWDLEQRAFQCANEPNVSMHVRDLVKDLWTAYCDLQTEFNALGGTSPVSSSKYIVVDRDSDDEPWNLVSWYFHESIEDAEASITINAVRDQTKIVRVDL